MKKPEPVGTSNTALAGYLLYHEHKFQGFVRDKHDSKRRVFYFIKEDITDELIKEFETGEPMVNARIYQSKLKEANRLLRDEEDRA